MIKKHMVCSRALVLSVLYRAFEIYKPHRHNQNLVETFHGTSLLWSTKMNFLVKRIIVILIKIETKNEYNKIKLTRNYFELCLTV